MNNPTHIIIHHSLTKDSQTVSWNAIKKYHTLVLGWDDIGYHYGIEKVNNEYLCMIGRPLTMPGAHTRSMNDISVGVCCVGDYDLEIPTDEILWELSHRIIKPLMHIFCIPKNNVKPHRIYSRYKTCPGNKFDMERLFCFL